MLFLFIIKFFIKNLVDIFIYGINIPYIMFAMRKSLELSLTALLVGLSVLFRYAKNVFTTVQFVNFPLVFCIFSGLFFGSRVGFAVGFLSYVISDFLILPGVWTFVNSLLAGLIGLLWGILGKRFIRYRIEFFVLVFLSVFLFDIASSVILYLIFGFSLLDAFVWGVVGLFLPVFGGKLIGVGPITEASTSFIVCFLSWELEKRGVYVGGEKI
ncbi:MAG: hypothetical protein DRJ44_04785 [Thermoprotei archaeon]|nr:MAG: hypothetical protein DRJ44_04785 [Thermoprotei archaeon]